MNKSKMPSCTNGPYSNRVEEVLLVCYYDPLGISTVPETVSAIQEYSEFPVTVINLYEHGNNGGTLKLHPDFNFEKYDAVIIHNSISYNVDNLRNLDKGLSVTLYEYTGVKVLMKQDENFKFQELSRYIGDVGFHVILTCLPDESIPIIYPESIVGSPTFYRMLTGYVTPALRGLQLVTDKRPIDIGYRGSIQPLSFGRLAYEKRQIGDVVSKLLSGIDISYDISSRWEDRIGGTGWFDFLLSCKATLGAESGASIFDLNGDLEKRCKELDLKYGCEESDTECLEQYLDELSSLEDNVNYRQISPRHFEAAATKTLQIMYPGDYSGIFFPGQHYVELRRDLSNIDEVVGIVKDEQRRSEIVERTYNEIILNRKYWIETFVSDVDGLISEQLTKKNKKSISTITVERNANNVLLICAHEPSIDPRLDWITKGAPDSIEITKLGIVRTSVRRQTRIQVDNGHTTLVEKPVSYSEKDFSRWFRVAANNSAGWAALSEISRIEHSLKLEENDFLEFYGAPAGAYRVSQFKWYLNYILDTAATLLSVLERTRGIDALIATDLDTLIPALITKGFSNVKVLYDAHEYWPEADVDAFEFERQFWSQMEHRLVQHVDYCQTVSPGLARLMGNTYMRQFSYVPNCELHASLELGTQKRRGNSDKCRFIFQGNFAPRRGIDLLINAWPEVVGNSELILRGPDNEYKMELMAQAKKSGLLGKKIFFPKAVKEDQLVLAAREGDVGLIPYTPFGANYSHCCPNKMSQYMAAGIPILANNTKFVKEIVDSAGIGKTTDFSCKANIVSLVDWFEKNASESNEMGVRAESYFAEKFNWNVVSKVMYQKIGELIGGNSCQSLRIYSELNDRHMYLDKVAKKIGESLVIPEDQPKRVENIKRVNALSRLNSRIKRALISIKIKTLSKIFVIGRWFWRFLPLNIRIRYGGAVRKVIGI